MREPHESFDPELHMQDEQLNKFEQQLREFRPRAPQLNLDKVVSARDHVLITRTAAARASGFTYGQLLASSAAAWIVGAVVGGSLMLWRVPPREHLSQSSPAQTEVNTAKPGWPEESIVQLPDSAVTELSSAINTRPQAWRSDRRESEEPLSVLSFRWSSSRLTSFSQPDVPSSSIDTSQGSSFASPAASGSDNSVRSIPTPMSGRQQTSIDALSIH